MAPRLKVFTWSNGFHAFTVAVSSRPKALAAWEVEQDLFATGLARELTAGPDYEAAMAAPGEVIRRGEAIDTGALSKAAPTRAKRGPTPAQRERVKRLEADLEALDVARQAQEAALEEERRVLEIKANDQAAAYTRDRAALRKQLQAARARMRA